MPHAYIYCNHTTDTQTHTHHHFCALCDPMLSSHTCLLHEWACVMAAEHTLLYQIAKVMKHSMCFPLGGSAETRQHTDHRHRRRGPDRAWAARHACQKQASAAPHDREEVRMREREKEKEAKMNMLLTDQRLILKWGGATVWWLLSTQGLPTLPFLSNHSKDAKKYDLNIRI